MRGVTMAVLSALLVVPVFAGCMDRANVEAAIPASTTTDEETPSTPEPSTQTPPSPEPQGPKPGALQGRVTDSDGTPVADATITLAALAMSASTDIEGRYRINDVAEGKYDILATHDEEGEQLRANVTVRAGTTRTLDFRLKPVPVEEAPTPEPEPKPDGSNFANTHLFFLMNLNDAKCSTDLGHGDILIANRLIDHARNVLEVPEENIHFYNEDGLALCAQDDPTNYPRLAEEYQTGAIFDGPATMGAFVPGLQQALQDAAQAEAQGGAPARLFILESSHGLWGPQITAHFTGSLMALNDRNVYDREFGNAITTAITNAEAGSGVSIESAILVDCSFCGGFGDSPTPLPGTTTTAIDSAKVVGDRRVVVVGCTWVTECFGNPAVTYDHMFNECVFTGDADGFGPMVTTGAPHPLPGGSGDLGDDVVMPSQSHHPKDGAITLEEAYWCALDSARDTFDIIGIQQMFQIVDQMDADMFGLDGLVLWQVDPSLGLAHRVREG